MTSKALSSGLRGAAITAGILCASLSQHAKADAIDLLLDQGLNIGRGTMGVMCAYSSVATINGLIDDLEQVRNDPAKPFDDLAERPKNLRDDATKSAICKAGDFAGGIMGDPGWGLTGLFARGGETASSITSGPGNIAIGARGLLTAAYIAGEGVMSRLTEWAAVWEEALGGIDEITVLKQGQLEARLLNLLRDIHSQEGVEFPKLHLLSDLNPDSLLDLLNHTSVGALADGVQLTPQRRERAEALLRSVSDHFPELIPERTSKDLEHGELSKDGAKETIDRLQRVAELMPETGRNVPPEPEGVGITRRFMESNALARIASGEKVHGSERREAVKLAQEFIRIHEHVLDEADRERIKNGEMDRALAISTLDNGLGIRFPDTDGATVYQSTFLLDGETVITIPVNHYQWDITEPAYRAVHYCLDDIEQLSRMKPTTHALIQAVLQGASVVRPLAEEERQDVLDGFSLAMRSAPILGGIADRYLLGYTPDFAYLGNGPDKHALKQADELKNCAQQNYTPLKAHSLDKSERELLAAVFSVTTTSMDAHDDTWRTLGATIALSGDVPEGQWDQLEHQLQRVNE